MKLIYDYTQQSISYGGGWTSYRYYQCETDAEYKECVAKAEQEKEDYAKRGYAAYITVNADTKITAREYHAPGCGWVGRVFDAQGLAVYKRYERSNEYAFYIKPGTLVEQQKPQRKVSFMDTLTDS